MATLHYYSIESFQVSISWTINWFRKWSENYYCNKQNFLTWSTFRITVKYKEMWKGPSKIAYSPEVRTVTWGTAYAGSNLYTSWFIQGIECASPTSELIPQTSISLAISMELLFLLLGLFCLVEIVVKMHSVTFRVKNRMIL